jgi:hypothetical protein
MNMALRRVAIAGLAAVASASFQTASAQTTTHTTLATFLAATTGSLYTETFTGGGVQSAPSYSFSSLGFGYTVTASPGSVYRSGTIIGNNLPNEMLTFTFTTGNITAIGGDFFITNILDAFQLQPVTLNLSNGTSVTYTPANLAGSFRGFTTTGAAITSLTMAAPTGGQFYNSVDNLIVGRAAPATVVPEPSEIALLATGMVGLIGVARRRARNA